jgi:1-acyl-sn-glycerol-3-phosphate acyltransferase
MSDLERLNKAELSALATAAKIPGRSKMSKSELLIALNTHLENRSPLPDPPRPAPVSQRRTWTHMLDFDQRCGHQMGLGAVCDYPLVKGASACALHGGINISDLAVPASGELGTHTWPQLRRHQRQATYDPDPLGLDPVTSEVLAYLANFLFYDWFKVDVEGIEHVPMDGPAVLVPNHAGAAFPYDAVMLNMAVVNTAPLPRRIRVVGTEFFAQLPFVSHLFKRSGGAYAARPDARWILDNGLLLGVFPEGVAGFQKPHTEAYQVKRFGRGGFAKLAADAGAPIVPVAIIGSEDTHPVVMSSKALADVVKLIFPSQRVDEMGIWLNPLPLPVKWTIRFLEPIHVPPTADRLTIMELGEQTRQTVQEALDDMLGRPRSR